MMMMLKVFADGNKCQRRKNQKDLELITKYLNTIHSPSELFKENVYVQTPFGIQQQNLKGKEQKLEEEKNYLSALLFLAGR